jgi:hypothetical protein
MRKIFLFGLLIVKTACFAQADTSRWLRAFPITDYMVKLNDSTTVVQLEMPENHSLKDKQLGVLWGVYNGSKEEAVQKGYGRCHLIKGVYYYFSIGHNTSGLVLKKGDLLYTLMDKTTIFYGQVPQLAAHFIRLLNVYEKPFYDRYTIFSQWNETNEKQLIDSLVTDIQFTGKYFIENNPSGDKLIPAGEYKDRKTFYVMAECRPEDIKKFFNYVLARPRLYAGREWKVSEIFATWLTHGAPVVLKD